MDDYETPVRHLRVTVRPSTSSTLGEDVRAEITYGSTAGANDDGVENALRSAAERAMDERIPRGRPWYAISVEEIDR